MTQASPPLTRGRDEISGGQILDKAGKLFFRAVTGAERIRKPGGVGLWAAALQCLPNLHHLSVALSLSSLTKFRGLIQ